MKKLDSVVHLKLSAQYIETAFLSPDPETVQAAEAEWLRLVDRFYEEHKPLITPRQYQTARMQFEYFMILLEMAIHHYKHNAVLKG